MEDLAAPEKGKGGEIDAAIQRILNCSSTDRADEAAIAFCYNNSKGARKRLVLILPHLLSDYESNETPASLSYFPIPISPIPGIPQEITWTTVDDYDHPHLSFNSKCQKTDMLPYHIP